MTNGTDPEAASAVWPPIHRLTHGGRSGELFVIFLINLALSILTLGIYRFWGRTRIRRYVWSQTSLLGEPLEYTGRGVELFLGFLFALVLIYGPIIGLYFGLGAELPGPGEEPLPEGVEAFGTFILILLAATPIFMLFYYVALFAAYRYRIGRTSWLGIRGGMEGSAWSFGGLGLFLGFLNVITLAWTKPWADSMVFQYRLSRVWFGNGSFESRLDAGGLYGRFTLAWIGTAVATIGAAVAFRSVIESDLVRNPTAASSWQLDAIIVAIYLFPIIVYQLLICAYKAALVRNIAKTLTYGSVRFRADVTFKDVFRLRIPNLLLMAFTLGFAYPYVVMRTMRFIARHVEIHGDIRTAAIGQTDVATPSYGEGLMEFFGIASI
ncbi:MAG: DUF898 domain-containing protein [Rhodospirillaceae bacterium]|nr:DUF898 domain-containing protein [Rhodospirillaceae bacterium]